jgi:nitrogen fixation/metabolism regulation signal transduction histidine kinase
MAERSKDIPLDLGVYSKPEPPGVSATEIIAAVLSVIWIGLVLAFMYFLKPIQAGAPLDPMTVGMLGVAVIVPLAMIWVVAVTARTARALRRESEELHESVKAMRTAYVVQQHKNLETTRQAVERKLDDLTDAQRKTEVVLAQLTLGPGAQVDMQANPQKPALIAAPELQPSLELGTLADDMPAHVSVDDFLRAVNFPEDENDQEGFRALRVALQDREIAQLIRAAEDVLTLLAQDGIYMDDLSPDRAKPAIWRAFAKGERGRGVAALAGVRDRSCLALTAGRMKADTVFRDSAHHFLRQFDKALVNFEPNASDQDLTRLSSTRTARAFMLLGRVARTFD